MKQKYFFRDMAYNGCSKIFRGCLWSQDICGLGKRSLYATE